MSFIDIKNIWQEYGDHVVLERINLQVKEGEFCSMVGASGCGKSTFLRLLLGQKADSRGNHPRRPAAGGGAGPQPRRGVSALFGFPAPQRAG